MKIKRNKKGLLSWYLSEKNLWINISNMTSVVKLSLEKGTLPFAILEFQKVVKKINGLVSSTENVTENRSSAAR
jgi:hypothetical protein